MLQLSAEKWGGVFRPWARAMLSCAGMAVMYVAVVPLFAACGLPVEHANAAALYCRVGAWGFLPTVMFQCFRLSLMAGSMGALHYLHFLSST